MSALDGWIDIFRTGAHRDSGGRVRRWSAEDLDRLVAGLGRGDPVPVVVGHPEADAPAFGRVAGLRRVGDRLQARLADLDPGFRIAVAAGRYSGRSVALEADGAGGFRLRHLGFLGGRAPAVSGLAPSRFAAPPAGLAAVYAFAAGDWRPAGDETDSREDDSMTEAKPGSGTGSETAPAAELDAARAQIAAERRALARDRAEFAAAARRRAAEAALAPHISAGRVLPAEAAALATFMTGLADDADSALTFAEGGGRERAATPRAFFEAFLARLPVRVRYGEIAGVETRAAAPTDARAAAAEARRLMAADAAGGLTIDRAVRRVLGKE